MNRYICKVTFMTNEEAETIDFAVFGRNTKEVKIVLNTAIEYGWHRMIAYTSIKLKNKNVETNGEDYFQKQLDILEMWKEKKYV